MKIRIYESCLVSVMALFILYGCASVPKSLSSEDRDRIKTVAVTAVLEDDELSILDITEIKKREYSKTYGGMMFGAIGGALEALIIEGISRYKIGSHVGGNIAPIRENIQGYNIKTVFNDLVLKGMSETLKESNKVQRVQAMAFQENSFESKSVDADALLKIEYKYGIGARDKQKQLPAITATVSIESIPDNRTLMKDTWIAYSCEEHNYTIDDYAKNGGEIYRRCFEEMVEQFGRNIAATCF